METEISTESSMNPRDSMGIVSDSISGKGILIEGLAKRYGQGDTAVDALKEVNMRVAP